MRADGQLPGAGEHYREARLRIAGLVSDLPVEAHDTPVIACPGWRVRDVVAHVAGIAEDGVAGRLAGVPTPEQTAQQVDRYRTTPLGEVLDRWARVAPAFEELVEAGAIWPAVVDAVSHEHDIRGATGRPGARDLEVVRVVTDRLLRFRPPVPITIEVEDARIHLGEGSDGNGNGELVLSTTRWEALRWRTGRRSRAQLAAMAWTGDPEPVLDHLVMFGPATADLIE